jgi:hypothetical protein
MSKPEYPQRFAALADFQQRLQSVVKGCAEIDIRSYELASVARLSAELRPTTLGLLGEARSMIASLLAICETLERPHPIARSIPPYEVSQGSDRRFEWAVDAAVASNRVSLDALDEVAFMAQLELRQRTERLERVTLDCEAATLLGECDSALRRLRKSLNAVGLTIARVLEVPPLSDYTSELESSLAVRRGLSGFRTRVTKGGEPTPNKLRERFSYISNQIEILVNWDIYSGLRVSDRLLLRGLQDRLLAWLNTRNASPEAGMRLWQDVAACVEMFALVSRRQELVEHDTALLSQCVAALGTQPMDAPVDATFWQTLRAIEGLDLELDALLKRPAPQVRELLPVLDRLNKQFHRSEEIPQPGEAFDV